MPMQSKVIHLEGGGIAIACTRTSPRTCSAEAGCCNKPATKQCDYPIRFGTRSKGTCDRYLCADHAHAHGDLDLCPAHHRKAEADARGR